MPRFLSRKERLSRASVPQAQEAPWPLPLRGLMTEAKSSRINNLYASRFENFRSDGFSMFMRDGFTKNAATNPIQRIPYEFRGQPRYIEIYSDRAEVDSSTYFRNFGRPVMTAYLSSQAIMVDGRDVPFRYDGTDLQAAGYTSSNVNVNTLDGAIAHQDRIYMWDSDGPLEFFYGELGAVTGELTRYPLDRLGNISGSIVVMASVSIGDFEGTNDNLVIMTSTGDMVIYEGLDPGDPENWRLWGRAKVAVPFSRFGVTKLGSDALILTKSGVISAIEAMRNQEQAINGRLARPIRKSLVPLIEQYGGVEGWQMMTSPDGAQVVINIPTGATRQQFIYDVEATAWRTADYPAQRWHALNNNLQFTHTDGSICTPDDTDGDDGAAITAVYHSSWVDFKKGSQISYLLPEVYGVGAITMKITALTDRNETQRDIDEGTQTITISPQDETDATRQVINERIPIGVAGDVFQLRIEITAKEAEFAGLRVGVA